MEETRVVLFLSNILDDETLEDEINQHMKGIMYWAILAGFLNILEQCTKRKQWEIEINKGKVPWTHVAALKGGGIFMKYFLQEKNSTLDPDDEGVTPFHIAVRHGCARLVRYILTWLEEPPRNGSNILKIILAITKEGETPLSLAASGSTEKHRNIETHLWTSLNKTIHGTRGFFGIPCSEVSNHVLELAAQYEAPREEKYLHGFLQMIPEDQPPESLGLGFLGPKHKWNTLYLAIYHQFAVVVWWLLSNGGYMNENDIRVGIEIIKKRNKENKVIEELLSNPPPILKRRARMDDHRVLDFQFQKQDQNSPEGIVVGFHVKDDQIGFQLKRRPINNIIYNDGPQKIIMENKYSSLDYLKICVENASKGIAKSKDTYGSRESRKLDKKQPALIWTNIPINNVSSLYLRYHKPNIEGFITDDIFSISCNILRSVQ